MRKLKANQDQLTLLLSSNLQLINILSMELINKRKEGISDFLEEWYELEINKLMDLQESVQG